MTRRLATAALVLAPLLLPATPASAAGCAPWSGSWHTVAGSPRGTIVLRQRGHVVTGRFSWNGSGTLIGTLTGRKLATTFAKSTRWPHWTSATLTISPDARTIRETWQSDRRSGRSIYTRHGPRCRTG